MYLKSFMLSSKRKVGIVALVALTLSGCATIFSGSSQSVYFQTMDAEQNPLPQVHCQVLNHDKTATYGYFNGQGSIGVGRNYNPLSVVCKAPGFEQQDAGQIPSSFNLVSILNVLLIGPVGIVLGGGIDALSGAMWKYPANYNVIMNKLETHISSLEKNKEKGNVRSSERKDENQK